MLNVYKASAGSGKTFRLTCEYIKMLLGYRNYRAEEQAEDGTPRYSFYDNYHNMHRHILAVTFTNKATDEMKRRIIEQLEILSHDVCSSKYYKELSAAFACDKTVLQENAEKVLQQILYDFSYFNISTIDSFFQQVLRAFTREIGLQGGYEVELDNAFVVMAAIDRLFAEVDENPDLLAWLVSYAEANVNHDKSWNIQGGAALTSLAKQLVNDNYKRCSNLLEDKGIDDYKSYIEELEQFRQERKKEFVQAVNAVFTKLSLHGVSTDVLSANFYKSLLYLADDKVLNYSNEKVASFKNYCENSEKCFPKTRIKKLPYTSDSLMSLIQPELSRLLEMFDGDFYREYLSVPVCLEYIYALGVLSSIDRNVKLYEKEHNTLLISKTPDILKGIINDSDTPFVYEKVGGRIAHYMIDEFQDTSNIQWSNFSPLIHESLAHGCENLIVGDVKQSIYRWRNSEWRLLHDELKTIRGYNDSTNKRDTNWRSCANIVTFNNTFFKNASQFIDRRLQERINKLPPADRFDAPVKDMYASVAQHVSSAMKDLCGHVVVNMLPTMKADAFRNTVGVEMTQLLKQLFEKGYKQRDILFLVRSKEDGRRIVELLLSLAMGETGLNDLRVISNESLLIANALPIKLILGILRYIQNPSFSINKMILSYEYELTNDLSRSDALMKFFEGGRESELNEELSEFISHIATLPLYEMCECIIERFNLDSSKNYVAYIEAFQDIVIDYCRTRPSDLYSFLLWWKDNENEKTVKLPDNLDAISVMTIHKAKGLEYPVVILPYATWDFSVESRPLESFCWLMPDREPFNHIPVLPISHKSALASTIFAKDFYKELCNEYIDNLNMLYVAFTRAVQELHVYTCESASTDRSSSRSLAITAGDVIKQSLLISQEYSEEPCPTMQFDEHIKASGESVIFGIGEGWKALNSGKEQATMDEVSYHVTLPSTDKIRLKRKSHTDDGDSLRVRGIILHEMLSEIVTYDDVAGVVQRYVREGRIRLRDAQKVQKRIYELIKQPDVARWFAHDVQVLVETDILKQGEKISRPDRVVIDDDRVTVIDYKFGKRESDDNKEQLQRYMRLMREMGYNHVTGRLWYVMKNKIVTVE